MLVGLVGSPGAEGLVEAAGGDVVERVAEAGVHHGEFGEVSVAAQEEDSVDLALLEGSEETLSFQG